jgi:TrmH RNA methyltransferase
MPRPERSPAAAPPVPEVKVHGVNACLAIAARRPDDVRRVYIHNSRIPAFGELLRRCAERRIAYHVVEPGELEKITASTHHEGVCLIVRERPPVGLGDLLRRGGPARERCLLYLGGVGNPHNLGAIVRVCAHFGADGVIVAGVESHASPAMLRTAEGGGEYVDVVPVVAGAHPLIAARRAGFRLIATSGRAPASLYDHPLPPRAVIMLGAEATGLAPDLLNTADQTIRIPGTGALDSLNVACAASVLLAEFWRVHRAAAT